MRVVHLAVLSLVLALLAAPGLQPALAFEPKTEFSERRVAPGTSPAPRPAATPTPAPALPPYSAVSLRYGPNCSITRVIVYLQDSAGSFVNGVVFRLETADGLWGADSYPTGTHGYAPGTTDFSIPGSNEDRSWVLFALDAAGNKQSSAFSFTTDSNGKDCNWDGQGRQIAWITFRQNPPAGAAQPAGDGMPFGFAGVGYEASCAMTKIYVQAKDRVGNPIDGVRFRIETVWGGWSVDSYPTGQDDLPDGETNFHLWNAPRANTWAVWAIDEVGNPLSQRIEVSTDDQDCSAGGHQIARMVFVQR